MEMDSTLYAGSNNTCGNDGETPECPNPRSKNSVTTNSRKRQKKTLPNKAKSTRKCPKRHRGKLINKSADLITSEDEEGKKDRQIAMEALDRLKLKKRNDEENMFKHFREAYGLRSAGTVEEIEKSVPKKTQILGENNKKKMKDNGVDGDTESKKRSKGSVESRKPDGKKMAIAEQKNKRKIDKEGGKKKRIKKPMIIPDTNPSENVNTKNNEEMASHGGQQINDENNEKKLPKKRRKNTNDEGGKGDGGKSKKPKRNQTNPAGKENEDNNVSGTKVTASTSNVTSRSLCNRTINMEIPDDPNSSQETQSAEEIEDIYRCKICDQTFKKHLQMKKHKLTCTKLGNKFSCDVCGKGFMQKSYCDQHFNFYHTNKPKKFVCTLCKKSFPVKKTLQEHNSRLHNGGDFKFVCDICG